MRVSLIALALLVLAAWVDTKERMRVAVATGPGRFGAARTLASASADGAIERF